MTETRNPQIWRVPAKYESAVRDTIERLVVDLERKTPDFARDVQRTGEISIVLLPVRPTKRKDG